MAKRKNEAAAALGALGGKARAKKLTSKQRREAARKAVEARWAKTTAKVRSLIGSEPGQVSAKSKKKK